MAQTLDNLVAQKKKVDVEAAAIAQAAEAAKQAQALVDQSKAEDAKRKADDLAAKSKLTPVKPSVIGTNIVNANGRQMQVITYSDGTTTTNDLGASLNQADAVQNLISTFNNYGLTGGEEIATSLANLVKKGYNADTITLIAQDPKSQDPLSVAYRKRFAGNEGRIAKGLAPLSPKDYLDNERAYAQVARAAGFPAGFYDNKEAFAKMIAADVSPTEMQSRANLAKDTLINADPSYLQQMQTLYGLDQSHALAHLLDPESALPLIEKQVNAVKLGAAAQRQGLGLNLATAEQLAGLGTTEAQANAGFSQMASQLPATQAIASRYSGYGDVGTIGQALTASTFNAPGAGTETPAQAAERIKRLQGQEIGAFSGSAGASQQGQSLGVGTTQGVL